MMKLPAQNVKQRGDSLTRLCIAVAVLSLSLVAAILWPNFMQPRPSGRGNPCSSNLRNIGAALELYAQDNHGRFPRDMSQLTPTYLKAISSCPAAGRVTYSYVESHGDRSVCTVICEGNNHAGVGCPPNFPQYSSAKGVLERQAP